MLPPRQIPRHLNLDRDAVRSRRACLRIRKVAPATEETGATERAPPHLLPPPSIFQAHSRPGARVNSSCLPFRHAQGWRGQPAAQVSAAATTDLAAITRPPVFSWIATAASSAARVRRTRSGGPTPARPRTRRPAAAPATGSTTSRRGRRAGWTSRRPSVEGCAGRKGVVAQRRPNSSAVNASALAAS
jgi:hypothetical protein